MNAKMVGHIAVMVGAALLEVGGDALIRRGLRGGGFLLVALGFAILGSYGVVLTLLKADFSKLLGAYVGIFALVSVAFGRLVFRERIGAATWLGIGVVLVGSMVIQWDSTRNQAHDETRASMR